MTEREAVEIIKYASAFNSDNSPLTIALDIAIKALEKQIPKKVVIKPWSETICPSCGESLSESLGDGYYKHHTHWEYCHNSKCLQRLDWSERSSYAGSIREDKRAVGRKDYKACCLPT